MKKFPFAYSPLAWALMILVALIFGTGAILNAIRAVNAAGAGFELISPVILALFCAVLFFADLGAMFYGRYTFKGNFLICRFGIVFFRYDLKKAFQLTEFKVQKKLVIYFRGETYAVAVINEKYYKDFYAEARKINPDITYTVSE